MGLAGVAAQTGRSDEPENRGHGEGSQPGPQTPEKMVSGEAHRPALRLKCGAKGALWEYLASGQVPSDPEVS